MLVIQTSKYLQRIIDEYKELEIGINDFRSRDVDERSEIAHHNFAITNALIFDYQSKFHEMEEIINFIIENYDQVSRIKKEYEQFLLEIPQLVYRKEENVVDRKTN